MKPQITDEMLVEAARKVKENAYAPYSEFRVGAALLDEQGKLATGCNIENASYGATCCAERTAIGKAVSEGSRQISRLAVISDEGEPCLPCGICRQVISEFATTGFVLLAARSDGTYETYTLEQLLPHAFRLKP